MLKPIVLTKTDKKILESYKTTLDGLSKYLGRGYEIILHSLESFDHSAIKVINGHYSGRTEGAPITDLALNMLQKIEDGGDIHQSMVYQNTAKSGEHIHAATIPIVGENERIIGLICINFYLNIPLYNFIQDIMPSDVTSGVVAESFPKNNNESIFSVVEEARLNVMKDPTITASNKNKKIIEYLQKKNVFQMKDSVKTVANLLGVSNNTVYMHIRNNKKQ